MDYLKYILIFLSRLRHCMGFGVQSPSDYYFVRNVIYERTPYYAYETLDAKHKACSYMERKKAKLAFRVANFAHPSRVFFVGEPSALMADYLNAARKDGFTTIKDTAELQRLWQTNGENFPLEGDVFIIDDLASGTNEAWQYLTKQPRMVSFDLYYMGISIYHERRFSEVHIVNFY